MMDKEKMKNSINIILNIIIGCQIVWLLVLIILFQRLEIKINDEQRKTILEYMEDDRIIGMTREECVECFGKPLIVYSNGDMLFDGGSTKRISVFYACDEYTLDICFDETGKYVDDVSYRCTLERRQW